MSGIFLRLAPARLVASASNTAKAATPVSDPAPAPVSTSAEGKAEAWTEGGPATRRYRPGQSVVFGYNVINPKLSGSAKEFRVDQQIRIYRNGKLLFTGQPNQGVEKNNRDPSFLVGGGAMRLGPSLPPGEYLLQVVVTDHNASKKKSQFAQWVDFEVVP